MDDPTEDTRVTKFQIAYSQDGVTFLDHQENGEVKVGNLLDVRGGFSGGAPPNPCERGCRGGAIFHDKAKK